MIDRLIADPIDLGARMSSHLGTVVPRTAGRGEAAALRLTGSQSCKPFFGQRAQTMIGSSMHEIYQLAEPKTMVHDALRGGNRLWI
jgi:hypothetical protein